MKNTRRDAVLDKFLGEEVMVIFTDQQVLEGKLEYRELFSEEYSFYPGYYHIGNVNFRKSTVTKIKRVGDEKWTSRR